MLFSCIVLVWIEGEGQGKSGYGAGSFGHILAYRASYWE
jgi:hypothetical protein